MSTLNCDLLARWYRWLEYGAFGGALQRRRVAFLPALCETRRALVLGDGDGRFLAEFVRAAPQAAVDCVELSGQMLALARERVGSSGDAANPDFTPGGTRSVGSESVDCNAGGGPDRAGPSRANSACDIASGRVRYYQMDARDFVAPEHSYDLIVTHFFLDCFDDADLARLVPRLTVMTEVNARWVVSEFHHDGGWRAAAWLAVLYRCFGLATGLRVRRLPDWSAALAAAGFQLEHAEYAAGGLLTSQRWRRSTQEEPGR